MDERLEKVLKARKSESYDLFQNFVIRVFLYKYMCDTQSDFYEIENNDCITAILESSNKDNIVERLSDAFMNAELSTIGKGADELFTDLLAADCMKSIGAGTVLDTLKAISEIVVDGGLITEFYQYSAENLGKVGGCETTSSCLADLVSELATVNRTGGSISDMTCGTGGMICKAGTRIKADKYSVMDISSEALVKAKIQLITAGVPCNCIKSMAADTIYHCFDEKYDIQVSNPPYGISWNGDDTLLEDKRFKDYEVLPPRSSADILFIENIIEHMAEDGRAVVICNMNPLNGGGSVSKIREKIIQKENLDAVIKIPGNCLLNTMIPVYVLIFENQKRNNDVFFMDSSSFFIKEKRRMVIDKNGIDQVMNLYSSRQERKDICYRVLYKDIEKAGYILSTESYIDKRKVERILKKEQMVSLLSVAEAMKPERVDEEGLILTTKASTYPMNYDELEEGKISNVKLVKGDIVFKALMLNMIYLVDEEPAKDVYASTNDLVIRPTRIQPEYLFFFFKSEIGKRIFELLCPSIVGRTRIRMNVLDKLDVPMPKKNPDEYRRIFEVENHLRIDISAYNALLSNREKYVDGDSVEDILNQELAQNIKTCKTEAMKSFLSDDIKELNLCFNAKAYKATLVLAGSILEAILIDWLSEIKGVDYFNNDYYVVRKDYRTGQERRKRADLIDYINEIKYIEKPNWAEGAKKADTIREKRNLVHAKLGIASSDINEHTCRMVIRYLEDVIKSRGIED